MQFQGVRIKQAVGLKGSDCTSDSDPYFVARIGLSGTSWEDKGVSIYDVLKIMGFFIPPPLSAFGTNLCTVL